MQELQCESRVVYESAEGPVICVAFRGYYPPGSAGGPVAVAMREYISEVVAKHSPAALMFDLTGLDYVWGDSILSIVLPFWEKKLQ